jgi:hypothetical protein
MALSKVAVRRLTKLADFMEKLPASANKHFHMGSYVDHNGEGHKHKIPTTPKPADLLSCGTTACAAGWAACVPAFKKAGYRMRTTKYGSYPCFKRDAETSALSSFFDLDEYDVLTLFGGMNDDRTPKQWAKRCRQYIRGNAGE